MLRLTSQISKVDSKQHCYELDENGTQTQDLGPSTSLLATQDIHEKVKKYQKERNIHQIQATYEIVEIGLSVINLVKSVK